MSADAEYLVATVGPVLSQGVAECLIADPEDYVAFVGQWLKQYVKNTSVTEQVRQEKAKDEANSQRMLAAAAAAKSALQSEVSHRQAVLAQVWLICDLHRPTMRRPVVLSNSSVMCRPTCGILVVYDTMCV